VVAICGSRHDGIVTPIHDKRISRDHQQHLVRGGRDLLIGPSQQIAEAARLAA